MKSIGLEKIVEWKNEGVRFQLIDVRSPQEHDQNNIGGVLIPLDELMRRCDEIDMNLPIIVYCRKGIRSQIAIQRLSERFPQADFYNLKGGIG